jgi:hypothetical protein
MWNAVDLVGYMLQGKASWFPMEGNTCFPGRTSFTAAAAVHSLEDKVRSLRSSPSTLQSRVPRRRGGRGNFFYIHVLFVMPAAP